MVVCRQCKWCQPMEGSPIGLCRYDPPKLMLVPVGPSVRNPNGLNMSAMPDAFPPVTMDTCWCGKGEPNA